MNRFKNILCVVAEEGADEAVVARAAALAQRNQGRLTVAVAVPELAQLPALPGQGDLRRDLKRALVEAAEARLAKLIEPHAERLPVETARLVDTQFLAIIRRVLAEDHDLVIKAPEDPRWSDRLFGSDDMHLLRKCPCPVWLHRPSERGAYRRILAAIDCDVASERPAGGADLRGPLNRLVFELASSMALGEGARLHLVHAWDAVGESVLRAGIAKQPENRVAEYVVQVMRQNQAAADAFRQDMAAAIGREALQRLAPVTHLVKGWARDVIPETAEHIEADLLVMGTVGRTRIPGFFIGNTAETVLSRLACSVIAVKPPGFESPVA